MRSSSWAYRPDIDGLRAIAISLVLIYHGASDRLPGGFLGVDVFFVISGYLITGIIVAAQREQRFSFRSFYAARVRRLYPALILVLAATLVAGFFLAVTSEFASLGKQTAASAFFVSNLYFWSTTDYFRHSELFALLHLWSLGVEEQYYLVWPVVLLAALKLARRAPVLLVLILALSLALNVRLAWADPTAAFYNPAARTWELMTGSLLGLTGWKMGRGLFTQLLTGGALGTILGSAFLPDQLAVLGVRTVLPVAATAILVAAPDTFINRRLLSQPSAVLLGKISYPLYLWHWPILTFLAAYNFGVAPPAWRIAGLAASLVLAFLTYRFVETPRFRKNVPALVAGTVFLGLAGLAISVTGLPGRPINRDPRFAFVARFRDDLVDPAKAGAGNNCNFYDLAGRFAKERVDPGCDARTERPTVVIWGDSHAASLADGIGSIFPAGKVLTLSTSACTPSLPPQSRATSPFAVACARSNDHAIAVIERSRPTYLVLAQMFEDGSQHEQWQAIARWAHRAGVAHVVAIGPPPKFYPSLPASVARVHWNDPSPYVSAGLSADVLQLDADLRTRYAKGGAVDYVSLIEGLCRGSSCLARLPGGHRDDLLFADYGHLTADGSRFVAGKLIASHLRQDSKPPVQP